MGPNTYQKRRDDEGFLKFNILETLMDFNWIDSSWDLKLINPQTSPSMLKLWANEIHESRACWNFDGQCFIDGLRPLQGFSFFDPYPRSTREAESFPGLGKAREQQKL